MKSYLLKLSVVLISFVLPTLSQAKVVTLTVDSGKTVDSISIGTNEVGKIITLSTYPYITVTVGSITVNVGGPLSSGSAYFVAGPATIQLRYGNSQNPGFCTVEVKPESFPPDKTLIIPADSKGANIIMEASTDLINWTNSVPGLYTNMTGNLFFRIRAERIP